MKFSILNQVNTDAFDLLKPTVVNCGSALSFAICVQRPTDGFTITGCKVRVTNADGVDMTLDATLSGSNYVVTFPASHFERYGRVENGVAVSVLGADESGVERVWIERMGSLYIRPTNAQSEAGSGVCPTRAEVEAGWWSEWTVVPPAEFTVVSGPVWRPISRTWEVVLSGEYGETTVEDNTSGENATSLLLSGPDSGDATATRHRVAAPVPTKTSDLTNDSGFLTQHQQLTPVYEGGVEWTYAGLPEGAVVTMPPHYVQGQGYPWEMLFTVGGTEYGGINLTDDGTLNPVVFNCSAMHGSGPDVEVTATRHPIIGYTLGSQTDKPLQPQGDYAPATNIAKTALAPDVQTSLGKADTAVQPSALRYNLVTITTGQLQDRAVQKVTLNAASTTLVLPALTDLSGKVSDFGIDVVNAYAESGTAAAASFVLSGTLGTDYNLIVPKGETWSDMTELAAGEMAVYYFTLSAFRINDLPTWEVMKKVVELVPVPTAP